MKSEVINPRSEKFQSRSQVRNLSTKSNKLYSLFNIFQLEMSRLANNHSFSQLATEITNFNNQLSAWKNDRHEIKNIVTTYYLYQNLFSRLRYVINFSQSVEEAEKASKDIMIWFYREKPKIRCEVQEIKPEMKEYNSNQKQSENIHDLIESTKRKRQMEPYETMARTAYTQLFPPKQRLKQYKRKQFFPLQSAQSDRKTLAGKKCSSASVLSKMQHSKMRSTMTTMMKTRTSMKETANSARTAFQTAIKTDFKSKQAELEANMELANKMEEERQKKEEELIKQQQKQQQQEEINKQLEVIQREKKVQQEEILQQNLVKNEGQEDEPEQQGLLDDEEQVQKIRVKVYVSDHEQINEAEEMAKEAQQSSLRRVMKRHENQMRSKMEDLNIKRNMMTWGKLKGKSYKEKERGVETLKHINKYNNLQYRPMSKQEMMRKFTTNDPKFSSMGFQTYRQKKKPEEVQLKYRSQSTKPQSIEGQIEKLKITSTMDRYKKYINHCNVQPNQGQKPQLLQIHSLTSFAKSEKKQSFSDLIQTYRPTVYNENIETDVMNIKKSLSGKSLPIENKNIYKALSVIPPQQVEKTTGMYLSGKDLPGNPFFPKHLFQAKKKKKKAK